MMLKHPDSADRADAKDVILSLHSGLIGKYEAARSICVYCSTHVVDEQLNPNTLPLHAGRQ